MEKVKKLKSKKIITIVSSVIVALLVLAAGYLTFCNMYGRIAFFGKYAIVRIVSGSMEPTIMTGEYILVEKTGPDDVQTGDVICFVSRDQAIYGRINTHRIVEIVGEGESREFVTKGDNNSINDAQRTVGSDVVARFRRTLPSVTSFAKIFLNRGVFFICIIIPTAVLIIICVLDVIKKSKEARMEYLVEQEVERLKAKDSGKKDGNSENKNNP